MFNLGTEIEKLVLADLDKTTQIDKVPTDLKLLKFHNLSSISIWLTGFN